MSGSQKGKKTMLLNSTNMLFFIFFDEKSQIFDFSFKNKPFCYEQTSSLGVPMYAVG